MSIKSSSRTQTHGKKCVLILKGIKIIDDTGRVEIRSPLLAPRCLPWAIGRAGERGYPAVSQPLICPLHSVKINSLSKLILVPSLRCVSLVR
ncbi:hypothetical protein E2C01_079614 [Portunus trituberculatus]|uniref:Uncharacterized protein n=1 Tax=Portunus trituberculatus TaxID=210409 RepID=A0A5B7IXH1_PORTR|nr:hypothetical protein [Portunus trituberculatus]